MTTENVKKVKMLKNNKTTCDGHKKQTYTFFESLDKKDAAEE